MGALQNPLKGLKEIIWEVGSRVWVFGGIGYEENICCITGFRGFPVPQESLDPHWILTGSMVKRLRCTISFLAFQAGVYGFN